MTITSSEDRRRPERAPSEEASGTQVPAAPGPPPERARSPRPLARLPRTLGPAETWGFGFTGLLLWLFVVEGAVADLGMAAMGLWVAAAAGAVVFNLQVKRMGECWPDVVGGTPNYVTRLYPDRPLVARYAGIAYFQAWASVVTLSAILLADLVVQTLEPIGVRAPVGGLRVVFAVVAFVVAFGGTRTLGMVHLFFLVPAVGGLLAFCLHGLGWLALASEAGASAASGGTGATVADWAKWYFVALYSIYGVDTASSFVAESRKPATTLRCLEVAAWFIPVVYVGGSLVVTRLGGEDDGTLAGALVAAATPLWGGAAAGLVTFLVAAACLLSSATATANSPRALYQMAHDGHLSPVFAVVSSRGVPRPALAFTLVSTVGFLAWGDATTILVVSGTSYFAFCLLLRWGLWRRRGQAEARWPHLSLAIVAVEAAIFVVGGAAWGMRSFLLGLALPAVILAIHAFLRRAPLSFVDASWWLERQPGDGLGQGRDAAGRQVLAQLVLVVAAAGAGWVVSGWGGSDDGHRAAVFAIFIVVVGFLGIAAASWTTLAQLSRAEAARRRADLLLAAVGEGVYGLDLDARVTFINPAGARLCGYEVSEVLGLVHHDLVHGGRADGSPYPPEECAISRTLIDGSSRQGTDEMFSRKDGRAFPVEYTATPVLDGGRVTGVVVTFRDITERERYEDELRHQAKSDRVTGLSNRSGFQDRLEARATTPATQAVLLVDLDDFKAVNDTFGHATGDQLLKAVGDRLRSTTRPGDTIARLGGDEFGALLEGASEESARAVARRFLDLLDQPVVVDGREIFVRASVGVALRQPEQEVAEVLRNSDAAMYAAKAASRPERLEVFDAGRHNYLLDNLALSSELGGAADRGELRLHYQPVVDMHSRRDIAGFEALVRWEHPQRGVVSPARFVPLAEQTGLILQVGRWVLEQACRQGRMWQDRLSSPPYISVNVSVRQLVDPEFVGLVRTTLAATGLRASGLVVEVTETAVATELDAISAPLVELRRLGVRVFMDDFGTGYSSLSYLRRLPVDVVKIDRSFVQEITTSSEEWSLAVAIVRLMKALDLATVVEGVEDAAQLAHLRALGCDFAQGFYFSRPKPPEEFGSLAEPGAACMRIQARDGAGGTQAV